MQRKKILYARPDALYFGNMRTPIESLKAYISEAGSARKAAASLGFSATFIAAVAAGSEDMTPALAAKLGWVKKERWVRK